MLSMPTILTINNASNTCGWGERNIHFVFLFEQTLALLSIACTKRFLDSSKYVTPSFVVPLAMYVARHAVNLESIRRRMTAYTGNNGVQFQVNSSASELAWWSISEDCGFTLRSWVLRPGFLLNGTSMWLQMITLAVGS